MILFFGTKRGKQKTQKLPHISCNYCQQTGTLTIVSHHNYFHLFWIPIFKIGTSRFAECSHCKKVYYKEELTREMKNAIG